MKKLSFQLLGILCLASGLFAMPLTSLIFQQSAKLSHEIATWTNQCEQKPSSDETCMKQRYKIAGELGQFVALVNNELEILREGTKVDPSMAEETNARLKVMQLEIRMALHNIKCMGLAEDPQCTEESASIEKERVSLEAEYKQTHAKFDGKWLSVPVTTSDLGKP